MIISLMLEVRVAEPTYPTRTFIHSPQLKGFLGGILYVQYEEDWQMQSRFNGRAKK